MPDTSAVQSGAPIGLSGLQSARMYDREPLIAEICARLSTGEPLAQICRDPHMPERTVVYDWLKENKEFAQRIAHARDAGFDAIAEDCLAIADSPMPSTDNGATDGGAVQHAKLRVETRLKLLAKWDPKRYGDKQQVEHSGAVDIAGAILAARKRAGRA